MPFRRIPAVSTKRYKCPSCTTSVSTVSMVVPGTGETMDRSSPTMRFSKVDLPTLGRPMIATSTASGAVSSVAFSASSCVSANATSSKSSTPVPCSAAIGNTGTPNRWNAAAFASCDIASTLFAATTNGFPVARSSRASSSSRGVSPAWLSTTSTSSAALLMAMCACRKISCGISALSSGTIPPVSTISRLRPRHSAFP